MHVEIQVALNFLISFLYNKLPRRRVNQFGEELENALKVKFEGHWYPEKPYKGSAYRCVRCTPPLDPTVFETAARASGMDLMDIQENLPQELSIWIDPGEVSYRMSEKGPVKILYSEKNDNIERENLDREVTRTFNPEAQCFRPIECLSTQFASLNMSNGTNGTNGSAFTGDTSPPSYKSSVSPISAFMANKSSTPVTFTTATFAQTKFGSTKLKSNSKRSHRMSPTEFSNYIKQRALLQQQHQSQSQMAAGNALFSASATVTSTSPHNSRSLSPNLTQFVSESANNLMLMSATNSSNSPTSTPNQTYGNGQTNHNTCASSTNRAAFISGLLDNSYLTELMAHNPNEFGKSGNERNGMNRLTCLLDKASPYLSVDPLHESVVQSGSVDSDSALRGATVGAHTASNSSKPFDNMNLNLNGVSYPNQYQHLLVAN